MAKDSCGIRYGISVKAAERCKAEVKLPFWTKCPSRTSLCRLYKWMRSGDQRKVSKMSRAGGWNRLRGRLVHPHLPTENLTALGSLHRSSEHGRDQRSPKLPSFQSHPLLSTFDIPIKTFSLLFPPSDTKKYQFFCLQTFVFSYSKLFASFRLNSRTNHFCLISMRIKISYFVLERPLGEGCWRMHRSYNWTDDEALFDVFK